MYLPLAELADRTARQLDERRAATGKWEPNPELVAAIRAYVPEFAASEDAQTELGATGDLVGDDVRVYGRELVPYVLLSPTGKAAKRLAEATLRDAYTIHRQLFSLDRQREQTKPKSRGPEVELYLPAEAVIVDEASMVDLPPLAWLLRSVGPQTRLIFVGDEDQLASVGPGSVLRDLIASGRIPVTLLTVIKRQDEGSPIVDAAHAINHGHLPFARSTAAGDLYILRAKSACEDEGAHALWLAAVVLSSRECCSPRRPSPQPATQLCHRGHRAESRAADAP